MTSSLVDEGIYREYRYRVTLTQGPRGWGCEAMVAPAGSGEVAWERVDHTSPAGLAQSSEALSLGVDAALDRIDALCPDLGDGYK